MSELNFRVLMITSNKLDTMNRHDDIMVDEMADVTTGDERDTLERGIAC